MAITLPESIPKKATAGERILFQTLKQYLDDDYIVYYEPDIHGYHPDFVILGPDLGLVVLEVKDYTATTLYQLSSDEWVIRTNSGKLETKKPPLKQARDYMLTIMDKLKTDFNLIQHEGKYRRNLKFPCGYGAVFTRLTEAQFIKHSLYDVMEPNFVFTRDDIDPDRESFSQEQLVEKLFQMFSIPFRLKEPLSYEEINAIRYHLFPEVRISADVDKKPYRDQLLLSLHNIQTMDLHQEKLAKQIGDKHRLLRGVAGSGKTLVLTTRAKLLHKKHPDWKILILCYNISLARMIEEMVLGKLNEPEDLLEG
ncbi:MAG TPA: NERD domain-containing protein, partial [Massilibacterium sp.]|nr:NERD domain-containing protein [Massilibacterium sp.]